MQHKIGIIGAGHIGQALATHLAKTSHQILLTNSRGVESLRETVAAIGGNLRAADLDETIKEADLLFIAVPWSKMPELSNKLKALNGKVLVDASNNIVSVNPFRLADMGGRTTGEFNAGLFSTHRVVKAFNTLAAATLAKPSGTGESQTVIFLSGDDGGAKAEVKAIIQNMGFAAIDLGSHKEGGKLQDVGGPLSGIEFLQVKK